MSGAIAGEYVKWRPLWLLMSLAGCLGPDWKMRAATELRSYEAFLRRSRPGR